MEYGLQIRQVKRWKTNRPVCQKSITNSGAITLFEVSPILILMMIGFVVSILVLGIELIIGKMDQWDMLGKVSRGKNNN